MTDYNDDIYEQVKARLRIEDVIPADGWPLGGHGRWRHCTRKQDGGLYVDVQHQLYKWDTFDEWGDVIDWVQRGAGQHAMVMDKAAAVEECCRRAGIPLPDWGRQDHAAHLAAHAREDALEIATRVFHRWLRASDVAKTYVRGRGWSLWQDQNPDEPTRALIAHMNTAAIAKLGYSGKGTPEERREITEIFTQNGVDLDGPVAIGILGYEGDVAGWFKRHELECPNDDWIHYKKIPGIFGHERLVYPHAVNGRTRYLSTRGIGPEKFHFNLPEVFGGKKQVYFNHAYATAADVLVIVEGQADAISWGQWGYGAMALCGVSLDEVIGDLAKKHKTIYLAFDFDAAGVTSIWRIGKQIGPLLRVLPVRDPYRAEFNIAEDAQPKQKEMIEAANEYLSALAARMAYPNDLKRFGTWLTADNEIRDVKDSNDLLRALTQTEMQSDSEGQKRLVGMLLERAPQFVEVAATWAGAKLGAARDEAVREVVALVNRLDEFTLANNVGKLAKHLQVTMRDLERMRKAAAATAEKTRPGGEPVYTWGGYVDGYKLEYLYDIDSHEASLAWRTPEGKVEKGPGVTIDGKYYEPYPPNEMMRAGSILFANDLDKKLSIRELVTYITMYLKSIYLLPSEKMGRLIAYWVMTTWLYDCFETVIYLRAMGGAGSGKSELMKRIGLVCYRLMTVNGAGSTSSLFRAVERYKGTVFIDEADIQQSDTESDMVKFYNLGAMRGNPIWRTIEVTGPNGEKDWESVAFQTFCPKLVAMRKDFRDDAVGSRSLTIKLQPREMIELKTAGIPLTLTDEIRKRAQALRNLLVTWRLYNWQPTIEVNFDFYDMSISPRLNQVAGPLLSIARDDPDQQDDIRQTLRDYYAETIISQSMTLAARVLEAMWKIWKFPDLRERCMKQEPTGEYLLKIGEVTRITNEIMTAMNGEEEDDDDEDGKKFRQDRKVKSQRVGRIVREELSLQVSERRRDGFWVYWNEPRMLGLSMKYGINPDDFGPQKPENQVLRGAEIAHQSTLDGVE